MIVFNVLNVLGRNLHQGVSRLLEFGFENQAVESLLTETANELLSIGKAWSFIALYIFLVRRVD